MSAGLLPLKLPRGPARAGSNAKIIEPPVEVHTRARRAPA